MARGPSFTDVNYAFIAVLVENPDAVFKVTEQRIAERMVENGWLTMRNHEVLRSAGKFQYTAKVINFVPTAEGLRKYEELRKLFNPEVDINMVKKAIAGEGRKAHLKEKLIQ